MTEREREQQGTADSRQNSSHRRRIVAIGAGGSAVILAGGVILLDTHQATHRNVSEPPVVVPVAEPSSAASSLVPPSVAPKSATSSVPTTSPLSSPGATAPGRNGEEQAAGSDKVSAKVRKEIEDARNKAAADGVELQRPLKQRNVTAGGFSVRTEKSSNGSIRVTTAGHDLTGEGPLAIVDGRGKREGDAMCTNKIRFSDAAPALERPTLLVCWRTSVTRSVVTMAVAPRGKPSAAESTALIDEEWKKLS